MTTVRDILHVMQALLDNKESVLKCNDNLWRSLQQLLKHAPGHRWLGARHASLQAMDERAARLWQWNIDDMARLMHNVALPPTLQIH